jgi:CRISPR-associated protein Csx3
MTSYRIERKGDVLQIGFGEPSGSDRIVRDVAERLDEMSAAGDLPGGEILKVNGPASLPAMCVITHKIAHLYGAIAVYDPKLGGKYFVCISHHPERALGDIIE